MHFHFIRWLRESFKGTEAKDPRIPIGMLKIICAQYWFISGSSARMNIEIMGVQSTAIVWRQTADTFLAISVAAGVLNIRKGGPVTEGYLK